MDWDIEPWSTVTLTNRLFRFATVALDASFLWQMAKFTWGVYSFQSLQEEECRVLCFTWERQQGYSSFSAFCHRWSIGTPTVLEF